MDFTGDFQTWFGGPGDFIVWKDKDTGDFGGGFVELQMTPNNGDNIICIDQLNVTGVIKFNLNHGIKLRAVLADTTSPSSGVFAVINV